MSTPRSLCGAFQECAARHPDRVALRVPDDRVRVTYAEYAVAVERVAGALASLGVQRGDRVMFLSPGSPQLAIAETATLHLGGVPVIPAMGSTVGALERWIDDTAPVALVVDPAVAERPSTPIAALSLDELDALEAPAGFDFGAAWRAVGPEDLAGVLSTSGTTGPAKGVDWQHGAALACFAGTGPPDRPVHHLSWLPMGQLSERIGGHWRSLVHGSTRTFCPDVAALGAALLDARPTFFAGYPRFWQQLRVRLEASFDPLERAGVGRGIALVEQGRPVDGRDPLLARLRARVGMDRIEHAVTVGAPCPRSVQVFFHALGLPFGELYGMTETGAVTQTRPGGADLGTVGVPLVGVELVIAGDGEVLVRSRRRARGYRNRPAATAATFGPDGWVRTGDVGVLDRHSRLRLVGRKDELMISSEAHNMAPGRIEAEIKGEATLIAEVCVIGHGRSHNVALIVLGGAGDASSLRTVVDAANARLAPHERVVRYAVLPEPWAPGGDELTETGKLRRKGIEAKHAAVIEGLYAGAA